MYAPLTQARIPVPMCTRNQSAMRRISRELRRQAKVIVKPLDFREEPPTLALLGRFAITRLDRRAHTIPIQHATTRRDRCVPIPLAKTYAPMCPASRVGLPRMKAVCTNRGARRLHQAPGQL